MARHPKAQRNGKRFIPNEVIIPILETALGQHIRYPICKQFGTTHAAGCAVTSLAMRTIALNLNHLSDVANVCYGELTHERFFTRNKLAEHIQMLTTVKLLVHNLLDGHDTQRGNLIVQTLSNLPGRSREAYQEKVLMIKETLSKQIEEMFLLLMDLEHVEQDHHEKRIEKLLQKQVSVALSTICEQLHDLRENMETITTSIKEDWNKDVTDIDQADVCRATY